MTKTPLSAYSVLQYCGGKGHLIPTFLKYLDGQAIGQCMASAPPVNGELLVRGNVESELEETVGRSPDFEKSS